MTTPDAALAARLVRSLDLTLLDDAADAAAIDDLCRRAVTPAGPVAAICVPPRWAARAWNALDQRVRLATVVNFPDGEGDHARILCEARAAVAAGAEELDVVFPWRAFAAGKRTLARDLVAAARSAAPNGVALKVILETGGLQDLELIRAATAAAIGSGADFIKTSTGRLSPGASLPAARAILQTIAELDPEVGFKASGGVRRFDEAVAYLTLAEEVMGPSWPTVDTFRLGASTLLDDLLARLAEPAPPVTAIRA